MLEKLFDTVDWARSERVEAWQEIVGRSLMSVHMSVDSPDSFQASLASADLGVAQLARLGYSSKIVRRPARLIRSSDPEMYSVALVSRGRQIISQSRREAVGEAGGLVVYASSSPYEVKVDGGHGTARCLVTQVPRPLLPFARDRLDSLLATLLPADEGVGALLAQFLTRLAEDSGSYRAADAPRLGTVLLDLLSALVAHHLDDTAVVPQESRERALILQIKAFVYRHLGDSRLCADSIAAAHHISTRHLHRIFRSNGQTIAAWIREQRLESARRDLLDAALVHQPIHVIAARWGFTHPAAFSRTFRAAYGISPQDFRHHAHVKPGADC